MSKKLSLILVICLSATMLFSLPAMATEKVYDYMKIVRLIVGETDAEVNYTPAAMEQAAYVKNGRTLVPFRFLGESLGAQISWDSVKKQAKLDLNGTVVLVTVGSKVAYVNGRLLQMEIPAETKGGRAFIPLRFVSENLGAKVDYTSETQTILVRYLDKSDWKTSTDPSAGYTYSHPSDWTVSATEDGRAVIVTSPKGSQMWIYLAASKPSDFATNVKEQAKSEGWVVYFDELDDPKDPNGGGQIEFDIYDASKDTTFTHIILYDPADDKGETTFVADGLYPSDDVIEIDNPIMTDIAYN